ncbi:hypothetical protein AYK26_05705 [Euryarchaeota archaeon SM23-78]|nr:MAG: hypothetical protein AYK26_05705 [Euryarchaeota archaeon SM23-78]MBW3000997.1 hypothetical protein [Candidatus Woesearchaeota archaeon]
MARKRDLEGRIHDANHVASATGFRPQDIYILAHRMKIGVNVSKERDYYEPRFSEEDITRFLELKADLSEKYSVQKLVEEKVIKTEFDTATGSFELIATEEEIGDAPLDVNSLLRLATEGNQRWYSLANIGKGLNVGLKELDMLFLNNGLEKRKRKERVTAPVRGVRGGRQVLVSEGVYREMEALLQKEAIVKQCLKDISGFELIDAVGLGEAVLQDYIVRILKRDEITELVAAKGIHIEKTDILNIFNRAMKSVSISKAIERSAEEYYKNNEWLHRAPEFTDYHNALDVLKWIDENKPERAVHSRVFYVIALYKGSKIENKELYHFFVNVASGKSWAEKHSDLIKQAPVFITTQEMVAWLVKQRTIREELRSVNLAYPVLALYAEKKVKPTSTPKGLQFVAGAANYAITQKKDVKENMEKIFPELTQTDLEGNLKKLANKGVIEALKEERIKKEDFINLKTKKRGLTPSYICEIVHWGLRFYGPGLIKNT